ncbi:hypothetical protein OF001_U10047 [Pseudomonas sp. OF001]|nr:hypothetical protein OF001_U10047 [Pseudomonas sp. OF001]
MPRVNPAPSRRPPDDKNSCRRASVCLSSRAFRPATLRPPNEQTPAGRRRSRAPGNLDQVQRQRHVPRLPRHLLQPAGGGAPQGPDPPRRGRRVRGRRAAPADRQAADEGRHRRPLQPEVRHLHPGAALQRRLPVPGPEDPPVHGLRQPPGHLPQPPADRPQARPLRLPPQGAAPLKRQRAPNGALCFCCRDQASGNSTLHCPVPELSKYGVSTSAFPW